MRQGAILAICLLGVIGVARADSLDINIHEHALRAIYSQDVGTAGQFEMGLLYNEERQNMANLGFHVTGQNWSEKGTFGISLGGRAIALRTGLPDTNVAALGLGGRVRFSPAHRVGVTGQAYYAPRIVTFLEGENFYEATLQLDYQLLAQAFVYAGYRVIKADLEEGPTVTIDDSVHVGMKLLF